MQFRQHYTRDEARALLPQIRDWLGKLNTTRRQLLQTDQRIAQLLAAGDDVGGDLANNQVKYLAAIKALLREFETREIQIKDLDRSLIDFPAIIGGKEVFSAGRRTTRTSNSGTTSTAATRGGRSCERGA